MLPERRRFRNVSTVATMRRGRSLVVAWLAAAAALAVCRPVPAAASHQNDALEIVVALNAAGEDKISVLDLAGTSDAHELASDVAISLDRPAGSFRTSTDLEGYLYIHPDAKLTQPDGRGGRQYALDTGNLQVLAQQEGFEGVIIVVCTPQVRQVIDALVAAEDAPYGTPGSRCRGWYQQVDDTPIRAVVHLLPDRGRYPWAMSRVGGTAAITFALLGLGATLLRRGPLRTRSLASWLLSIGAAVTVAGIGWATVSLVLWITGAPADPMLLGGGTVGEQVARTLLPGLAFLVPALLPAAILLSAPRRQQPPPPPAALAGPQAATWWPTAWWERWASQGMAPPVPARPPPPPPHGGGPGWTPPGAGGG